MSNLPPGVTNRMIEDAFGGDGPCAVCGKHVDDCVCPECPVCHGVGDPKCYGNNPDKAGHGMKLNKAQAVSRQQVRIFECQARLGEEQSLLQWLKLQPESFQAELDESPDPWS